MGVVWREREINHRVIVFPDTKRKRDESLRSCFEFCDNDSTPSLLQSTFRSCFFGSSMTWTPNAAYTVSRTRRHKSPPDRRRFSSINTVCGQNALGTRHTLRKLTFCVVREGQAFDTIILRCCIWYCPLSRSNDAMMEENRLWK